MIDPGAKITNIPGLGEDRDRIAVFPSVFEDFDRGVPFGLQFGQAGDVLFVWVETEGVFADG